MNKLFKIIMVILGIVSFVLGTYLPWVGIVAGILTLGFSVFVFMDKQSRNAIAIVCVLMGVLGIVAGITRMLGNPLIDSIIIINNRDVIKEILFG